VVLKAARLAAAGYVLWTALILCACACAVYLAAEIGGRYTPGANDNGTGVALALWLASSYGIRPEEFPADCALRSLHRQRRTGCRGMRVFLKSEGWRLDWRRVRFVNLDNLGTGIVTYFRGAGMLFYRRARPHAAEYRTGHAWRRRASHAGTGESVVAYPRTASGGAGL
jgi:hypothetical protein